MGRSLGVEHVLGTRLEAGPAQRKVHRGPDDAVPTDTTSDAPPPALYRMYFVSAGPPGTRSCRSSSGSKKARKRLQYTNDRMVLRRADALAADPTSSRVYLVRHASAIPRARWKGKERARPLDRHGRKQAIDLAVRFKAHPITRIDSDNGPVFLPGL